MRPVLTGILLAALPLAALAEAPKVEDVRLVRTGEGWTVNVTISHPDKGDHYADAFAVEDMSGKKLTVRDLSHPHQQQPFTRSVGGMQFPKGTKQVKVRARCSKDGWNGSATTVSVPGSGG